MVRAARLPLGVRDGWAQANPSLGHTITERAVTSALRTDPEPVFRTEVLCQWVDDLQDSAIDVALWASLADPAAPRGTAPPSPSRPPQTGPGRP